MANPRESFDTGLRPSDIDPAHPRPIETPWGSIAIFSCAGRLFATQSFCPHLMGPLFQGTIAGETVTCPWHEWRFSLRTGCRLHASGEEMPGGPTLVTPEIRTSPNGTLLLVLADRSDVARP